MARRKPVDVVSVMPVPVQFASKSLPQIQEELLGFSPSCLEAALRYRESGNFADVIAMLPGMIAYHLPRGSTPPPEILTDDLRLNQDLGLDSLALGEMAFKVEHLFDLTIEMRELVGVATVGDLKVLMRQKLEESVIAV